jgi:hypothetical protein
LGDHHPNGRVVLMAFTTLLDTDVQLRRDDAPLRVGYPEEQIKLWVEEIWPDNKPTKVSELVLYAAADYLGAGALGYRRTKKSTRYSRKKDWYNRYSLYGYDVSMKAIALLDREGFIDHNMGVWFNSYQGGNQSWFTPTPAVMERVSAPKSRPSPHPETIVIKNADKKLVDYQDTPETIAMRSKMALINEKELSQVGYDKDNNQFRPQPEYRQFRDHIGQGGRFVASYHNTPAVDRLGWEFVYNGRRECAAEADITGTFPALCYAIAGVPQPKGDPYAIPNQPRTLGKMAFNTMLFSKSKATAKASISHQIYTNERGSRDLCGLRRLTGCDEEPGHVYDKLAGEAIKAIEAMHPAIKDFFYQGRWGELQRMESDIATDVRVTMIERTGWCPRAVHDSLIIPSPLLADLVQVMRGVMRSYGVTNPEIKTKGEKGDLGELVSNGGEDWDSFKERLMSLPFTQRAGDPEGKRTHTHPTNTSKGVTHPDLGISETPNQPPAPSSDTPTTPKTGSTTPQTIFCVLSGHVRRQKDPPDPLDNQTQPTSPLKNRYPEVNRQLSPPKNTSRSEYEHWVGASLPHDPRPDHLADPCRYLAWHSRNEAFLREYGTYKPRSRFELPARDYFTHFAWDQYAAKQLVREAWERGKPERKRAGAIKAAETRKRNREARKT